MVLAGMRKQKSKDDSGSNLKEWYLITTWVKGVRKLDVVGTTAKTLKLRDGKTIIKASQTYFTGNTREATKAKFIAKLKSQIEVHNNSIKAIQKRIEEVNNY